MLLLVLFISISQQEFRLQVKSPSILQKHFGKKGISNIQILEGAQSFMYEEILNIVTFDKKKNIGCKKFDMGKVFASKSKTIFGRLSDQILILQFQTLGFSFRKTRTVLYLQKSIMPK